MKKAKESAPHVKAAQIEKEAVRALSVDEVEEALTASTFEKNEFIPVDEKDISTSDLKREIKKPEKANRELQRDLDVVCAENIDLKNERDAFKKASKKAKDTVDGVMTEEVRERYGNIEATFAAIREKQLIKDKEVLEAECAYLKEENRQLKDSNVKTNKQLRARDQEVINLEKENESLRAKIGDGARECIDLKKTISKMKQEHEAEMRELGDELMEAKAEANAVRKQKDEIIEKNAGYVDALDNDSIAFERIVSLAGALQRNAQTGLELARIIEAETEGRI